jgi:hypothetical protein
VDLTISRPIKIFALVAVIAAVGGLAMITLSKPKHSAAPIVVEPSSLAPAKTATTHATAPAKAKASRGTRTAPPTSVAPLTTPVAPAQRSSVGANGLPLSIDAALHSHPIVVVSVFDPQSSTDAISYAEAKAGAGEAGAAFVGVSLLDSTAAAALTTKLPGGGLLPEPGVLIYRRPGTLVERLDGFNDRAVVAQAAAASRTAAPVTGSGAGS